MDRSSYQDLNDTEFNSSTMHPISKHDNFDVMIKCIVLLWFFGEFRDGHVQGFIQKQCHNSDKNCGTSALSDKISSFEIVIYFNSDLRIVIHYDNIFCK